MNDLQKLIDKVIDKAVVGCDTYKHNGSTWLLFTDDKKWVIELTKEGTLWYNYYFFKKLFKVIALDVVENQHYITKWVEDTVINGVKSIKGEYYKEIQKVEYTIQNGVKSTSWDPTGKKSLVEDTIQNGVKHTIDTTHHKNKLVEDAIENGVKETHRDAERHPKTIEDAIQNGVKKTYSDKIPHEYDWSKQFTEEIDDIIQNGVKHTEKSLQIDGSCVIEDVIKEGVKHTEYGDWLDGDERFDDIIENGIKETHDDAYHHTGRVKGVIKNGVKECMPSRTPLYNPMDFSVQYRENHRLDDVASVLEKGIKEVQPLPSQEGNMDYSNYYYRQGVPTKPHTQYVNDVITNGIKKTKAMDEWVNTDRIVDGVISGGSLIR